MELVGRGRCEQGTEPLMIFDGHFEDFLRRLAPPRICALPAFIFGKGQVVQIEVGAGEVGDRAEGVPLLRGPAAEVEDDRHARSQHLVADPDESAFQNVALPTEVGPTEPEQRRHPLVGCQPQGTVGLLQLASQGRLPHAWQADREMQCRP